MELEMTSLANILLIRTLGLFGLPGRWEIAIIILLILLLFGGKKLPKLAKTIAKGFREINVIKTDIKNAGENVKKIDKTSEK